MRAWLSSPTHLVARLLDSLRARFFSESFGELDWARRTYYVTRLPHWQASTSLIFLLHCQLCNFVVTNPSPNSIFLFYDFADMASPKVPMCRLIDEIVNPPWKRSKGITIQDSNKNYSTTQFQPKRVSEKVKDKGKGKQKVIEEQQPSDDSYLGNISWSDDDVPSQGKGASTPVHAPFVETQPLPLAEAYAPERTRTEICSEAIHDPLAARKPRVVPVIAPRSMNILK